MMGRRRSGIKVYRAGTDTRKRDRGSLSLFVLQSVVMSVLMALWWNAFLSVFRLPFDIVCLYGITAVVVVLTGVLNRRFGAIAVIAGIAAAVVLLWYSRDTVIGLYEWIVENSETLFSVQTAGNRSFSYVAVLISVPILELLLWIQRSGKGKWLAGLIICAPFIAAACAGWFQTELPSWLLLIGAVAYFASAVPGAGRTGKGLFVWRNAVLATAVCAVLAVLSWQAGLFLDTGRETEGSFYFQVRGTLTTEVVGGIQDLLTEISGTDFTEDEQDQTDEVPVDEDSEEMLTDESVQSEFQQQDPDLYDPLQNSLQQENTAGAEVFDRPFSEMQGVTDLGSIASFVPSTEGMSTLVLDEKPESTVYFPESWGTAYSDNVWRMTQAYPLEEYTEAEVAEMRSEWAPYSYPLQLGDMLDTLCSEWSSGPMEEVSAGISRELHQRAVYDTAPGAPPAGEEFLHYFLFENHKGFCVHFATAATLMYRYCGYTARYVEGYAVPASAFHENEVGQYEAQITGEMGHAWCQVYDEETGEWTDMEYTPPAPENVTGQPPAASSDYEEPVGERVMYDVLPVLLPICIAAGVCAVLFFGQAAVRAARREQRFRKKKGGEGIREMYAAVIKTAAFQGTELTEPFKEELTERLYEVYPELEEKEWKWMYNCVMESLFYHLDDEKKDWTKMRELYTRFRKAALGHMSRGQRWRYRYVRCL